MSRHVASAALISSSLYLKSWQRACLSLFSVFRLLFSVLKCAFLPLNRAEIQFGQRFKYIVAEIIAVARHIDTVDTCDTFERELFVLFSGWMGCRSEAYWAARWVFAVCCHRRWSRCRQSTNRTAARIIQTPCWSPQPRCYKLRQTERTEATRRSTWCVLTVCVPLGLCKDQCGGGGAVSFSTIYWFNWIWITFSVRKKKKKKYRHAKALGIALRQRPCSPTHVWLAWQSWTLYDHHPPQLATQAWFKYKVCQSVKATWGSNLWFTQT